jgi:hypothetical protein
LNKGQRLSGLKIEFRQFEEILAQYKADDIQKTLQNKINFNENSFKIDLFPGQNITNNARKPNKNTEITKRFC